MVLEMDENENSSFSKGRIHQRGVQCVSDILRKIPRDKKTDFPPKPSQKSPEKY